MYRVLIVDDEPDIRLGLNMKVDWQQLGLELAGEAGNGAEAMEWLTAGEADIVITDMNMPMMNGVTFLKECRDRYPDLKLIVITGYEDFHYAKAAIQSQAKDYLLKPVARDELNGALARVVAELEEASRTTSQKALLEWKLSQYYAEMREHYILQAVKAEGMPGAAVRERAKLFELDHWESRTVRFVTAGMRERRQTEASPERSPEKLSLPFQLLCREYGSGQGEEALVFYDAGYPGLMHFIVPGTGEACTRFVEGLKLCLYQHLRVEPVAGTGQPVEGLKEWREGYLSALLDWNLQDTQPAGQQTAPGDISASLSEETAALLRQCLLRGEEKAFGETVHKELSQSFSVSRSAFVKTIFQIYMLIEAVGVQAGVHNETGNALWVSPELALGLRTIDKAEQFLTDMARLTQNQDKEESADPDRKLVRTVELFIRDNYMYDLTLTMLADRFNYHPSYFSELFKSKMGKSFVQYVTEVRLSQAVRLLEETPLSLWDISELTGFANASYFSTKFKRQYGVSPSDYRQARQHEKSEDQQPKK